MNNIRFVCLSDLHLGAENSILTRLAPASDGSARSMADPARASDVMVALAGCLRTLLSNNPGRQKPTLVLNGDALELALADVNVAAMVFERFMELTMKPGEELFDKTIYYNPGNHDHHLWEAGREAQYIERYLPTTKWGDSLEAPWHTTKMFLGEYDPVPCYLLDALIARMEPKYKDGTEPRFLMVYPNFGVRSDDRSKCVIFSHGHYVESIYRLMTGLRSTLFPGRHEPDIIWDLESENFAWVDFFWSTLGRSGDFGVDVELIYDKLQSSPQLKAMADNLADGIARKYKLPFLPGALERTFLNSFVSLLIHDIAHREAKHIDTPLSPDAEAGLRRFIEAFLLNQIRSDNDGNVPPDVTFIFGHTHKPFELVRTYAGYETGVKLFNSGGWVVDSLAPAPLHGGAVILVDEDLNTASLRIYNQSAGDSEAPSSPHVSEVIDNPLVQQLKLILADTAPWNAVTQAITAEIPRQRQNLGQKIQEQC